jgi:hypothetical protein
MLEVVRDGLVLCAPGAGAANENALHVGGADAAHVRNGRRGFHLFTHPCHPISTFFFSGTLAVPQKSLLNAPERVTENSPLLRRTEIPTWLGRVSATGVYQYL